MYIEEEQAKMRKNFSCCCYEYGFFFFNEKCKWNKLEKKFLFLIVYALALKKNLGHIEKHDD